MNYLYNGVELPDINEVWDKAQYPYARISVNDAGAWSVCFLDYPITLGLNLYINIKYYELGYGANEGKWVRVGGVTLWNDSLLYNVKWSNHDILNADDSVYFPKSADPIPVSSFTPDPISMTMGWLVGRRIAGQRSKGATE